MDHRPVNYDLFFGIFYFGFFIYISLFNDRVQGKALVFLLTHHRELDFLLWILRLGA